MNPLEIADKLKEKFIHEVLDVTQFRDQVSVSVKRDKILEICRYLREDPDIYMDYLSDLCGADYPGRRLRFEVVYNLYSLKYRSQIRIKAMIPENELFIDSVVPVWRGADWHEREACDMFGIVFNGHPDLRRILMPEDWEGHPLRKDYPLKGPDGDEYRKYEELKELHTHDDEWNIKA